MTLTLTRTAYTPNGVFGVLTGEGGLKLADTLEHAYAADDPRSGPNCLQDQPKLPVGTYTCVKGTHTLDHHPLPFQAFEVTGVPGHTGILFHIGNYNNDSDGCILLGQYLESIENVPFPSIPQAVPTVHRMLIHSADTFNAFMTVMQNIPTFTLVVINQGDV